MAAIADRTVHAYHVEGTGGGHVPDLGLVREPSILCSSTTPTILFGVHAAVEHVPMTVLSPRAVVGDPDGFLVRGASSRRGWRPRARSTSCARSRSSTPTRRAWAESGRRCAGVPARPRHEGLATERGREGVAGLPDDPASPTRTTATTRHGCCATSPRRRSSSRSPTASPIAAPARPPGGRRPVEGLLRRRNPRSVQGRVPGAGVRQRRERDGRAGRADPLPGRLGRGLDSPR